MWLPSTTINSRQPPLQFGYAVGFDLGSSQGATGKVAVFNDSWTKVGGTQPGKSSTMLKSVNDNNDLLNRMAELIQRSLSSCASQLSGQARLGKTFVFFLPGQPASNGFVYCLDDLKTEKGAEIPPLNMNAMPQLLSHSLPDLPLSSTPHMILINDVAGGLAASLVQLARLHPAKFKPGMEAVYLMSGGGLGVADASYTRSPQTRGEIKMAFTETSSLPYFPLKNPSPMTQSNPEWGGHIGTLLDDFTNALPERLHTYKQEVINSRNGRIVTSFGTAQKIMPSLTRPEYEKAAKTATDHYINTLSYVAAMRVCSGTNLAILAGPLTQGIKAFVNQNANLFSEDLTAYSQSPLKNGAHFQKREAFDQVFLSRVWYQLNHVGQDLFKNNGFDLVSDLPVADNTEGTPYIAQGWFANRNDRYIVPAAILMKESAPQLNKSG